MERARKMVIIPEETLTRMQQQQQQQQVSDGIENSAQTPGDATSRLDNEMFEILNTKKFSSNEDKCKQYLQVLRRYLFHKKNYGREDGSGGGDVDGSRDTLDTIDSTFTPLSEEAILEGVPKAHVQKARVLLAQWRMNEPDRLKWDNAGRVNIDGKTIPGSDIIELLNDALKKKKKKGINTGRAQVSKEEEEGEDGDEPVGRFQFAKFIGSSETPIDLIGNSDVLKIANRLNNPTGTAVRGQATAAAAGVRKTKKRKAAAPEGDHSPAVDPARAKKANRRKGTAQFVLENPQRTKNVLLASNSSSSSSRQQDDQPQNKSFLSPMLTRTARLNRKWKKITDI